MKKILFNDKYGLTQAVLEGRKTQTRRIVPMGAPLGSYAETVKYAQYKEGEIVAIAQNYKDAGCDFYFHRGLAGWNNKMFVRANEMPHRIKITNIRIEHLQDISDEDCFKEGIEHDCAEGASLNWVDCEDRDARRELLNHKMDGREGTFYWETPQQAYASLIDHISGKGTWDSNPYVFVYDFELVK